jgi:uncharacterized membrane protein
MFSTFIQRAVPFLRQLHVRVLLIAALSLLSVALAKLLGPIIPIGLANAIGADAVDPILTTLASSMLAVTIFSLTMMVSAHQTAASQWSPRTHVILTDDMTTQSVLATFVGAYLFSLSALILRRSHFFGERESVALFVMTIVVVAMIVVSIIRWIAHLEDLGSLEHTVDSVQIRAEKAVADVGREPCYGAQVLEDHPALVIDPDTRLIKAPCAGYIQQIFVDMLQSTAAASDAKVYVTISTGHYVAKGAPLAYVSGGDAGIMDKLDDAFSIAPRRSFVQDPRFGVSVMAEIASRALSPGINDAVTAVDIANRLSSVLVLADPAEGEATEPDLDRVWMLRFRYDGLFLDSYDRIARDAGANIEVQIAVQLGLANLIRGAGPDLAKAARDCAKRTLSRAREALRDDPDLARLNAVAAV